MPHHHPSSRPFTLHPSGQSTPRGSAWVLPLVFGLLLFCTSPTVAAPLSQPPSDCLSETTLETLVACIVGFMPTEASEEYTVPTGSQLTDWKTVIASMLAGNCGTIVLPVSLQSNFTIQTFNDTGNSRSYCLLAETADGDSDGFFDLGWGTFIVYAAATTNLSIDISHPRNDTNTPEQGIVVFKNTGARTFSLANAHRRANSVASSCQGSFHVADAAHNTTHTFHATLEAMDTYYSGLSQTFHSIQFHGMATDSCPGVDVYITHGRNTTPSGSDPIDDLKANFIAAVPSAWGLTVTVPGDSPSCTLTGTTNVQGRLLNGVTSGSECGTAATSYSGHFIHIEQVRSIRTDTVHAHWVTAINNTSVLPVELTSFKGIQQDNDVLLTWSTASETQNAGFEVQHARASRDVFLDWQPQAFIQGHGTTLTPQFYTHRLTGLEPGIHAFRLKQQDYDGSLQYSATVEVRLTLTLPHYVSSVAPNPFSESTTFTIQLQQSQTVSVDLFDNTGRRIDTPFTGLIEANMPQTITLPNQTLANGVYHVRITGDSFQETRTVLHMK